MLWNWFPLWGRQRPLVKRQHLQTGEWVGCGLWWPARNSAIGSSLHKPCCQSFILHLSLFVHSSSLISPFLGVSSQARQFPFAAFCVHWLVAVISFTIPICNWTLQTCASPPSCSTNPLLPLTLGCQHNEGLISILPLISLFTALQVNADSKLQQAAVKHVINTAPAANETLLLGLFWEL